MPTYQHHRLGRQGLWPIRRLIGAFWLMATASTCVACVSSAESIDPQAACPPADKVNPLPALHEAAYEGDLGKVKAELKAGADVLVPDARNRTALNLALVQPIGWPSKDPSAAGRPDPEAEARQKAKIAIARALIEAGAPIDIPDCDGMMPLHQLVGFRGPEAERLPLLEAMIEEGAPLAPLTWGGTTWLPFLVKRRSHRP